LHQLAALRIGLVVGVRHDLVDADRVLRAGAPGDLRNDVCNIDHDFTIESLRRRR
jgi:hypothetical protein